MVATFAFLEASKVISIMSLLVYTLSSCEVSSLPALSSAFGVSFSDDSHSKQGEVVSYGSFNSCVVTINIEYFKENTHWSFAFLCKCILQASYQLLLTQYWLSLVTHGCNTRTHETKGGRLWIWDQYRQYTTSVSIKQNKIKTKTNKQIIN